MYVACALLPRFALISALDAEGGEPGVRRELLHRPLALAPEPGGIGVIGEVSGPAEAYGVKPGIRLGEALSRCPELTLVPPDPARAERDWEDVMCRLEAIGAAVAGERPGEAFFEAGGLRGLWGGDLEAVLARARRAIGSPVRLAAAPSRFCAYAAANARAARRGRPVIVAERRARAFLAPLPVSLLCPRVGRELPRTLERLGIGTLGKLAALGPGAVADRFGATGMLALRLARGEDDAPRPRRLREPLAAELELPEAVGGAQLERALELLIDRLFADPARHGQAVRRLRLSARLAGGGGWRCERALRRASSSPRTARLVLAGALEDLPGPAELLRLEATALGPAAAEQLSMAEPGEERRRRLAEAVRQTRAAAGAESVLRVLDVDPGSRLPERRAVLTPFHEH
ncbi:MAG: DNA polymerase Y family protein [Solirubrobacterales bacterium]